MVHWSPSSQLPFCDAADNNSIIMCKQCSAEKVDNWGKCPSALEKVRTFEKKVGTLWGK